MLNTKCHLKNLSVIYFFLFSCYLKRMVHLKFKLNRIIYMCSLFSKKIKNNKMFYWCIVTDIPNHCSNSAKADKTCIIFCYIWPWKYEEASNNKCFSNNKQFSCNSCLKELLFILFYFYTIICIGKYIHPMRGLRLLSTGVSFRIRFYLLAKCMISLNERWCVKCNTFYNL